MCVTGAAGQEGLGLKPVSYSGSNTDGSIIKDELLFLCSVFFLKTVVKPGKWTYEEPGRWREHPAAEINDRRIQVSARFYCGLVEIRPVNF